MNSEQIKFLKETYQPGTSIRLISMDKEPQMPSGMMGVATFVDDIGQIHARWNNGSSLALNCEVDAFVAFTGPTAGEYLWEKLNLSDDTMTWYREGPDRFTFTAVDVRRLTEAAERYIEKNLKMTKDLAVVSCRPYDTVTLWDAFVSAHVLTDEVAREIRLKRDFSAAESNEWHCPKCGADVLKYGQTKLGDSYVETPWTCEACGSVGKEYGKTEFDGHRVEKSPYFEEDSK